MELVDRTRAFNGIHRPEAMDERRFRRTLRRVD